MSLMQRQHIVNLLQGHPRHLAGLDPQQHQLRELDAINLTHLETDRALRPR